MKRSNLYFWLTLSILLVSNHIALGQEISVHNLPKDLDFSSLEANLFEQGGEEKLYIKVVFARIGYDYIYLNHKQILEFDKDWIANITLVKSSNLLAAINYKGPYRVVVYNIKESKKEELLKAYLQD